MEKNALPAVFLEDELFPVQGTELRAGRNRKTESRTGAVCDTEKCEKTEDGGQQLRAQRGQSGASDAQTEKVQQYEIHCEIKEEPQDHDGHRADLPVLIP